jgi:branched-chain amino acid transport system substrate-binding protein
MSVQRIGYAAPLTGPQAMVGLPMLRVVQLAVADGQRDGREFEVVAVDDKADEATAARVAAELAADSGIIAVVGHKNSGPSGAGAPIYAAAGLTQLSQCSTDNALSRSGWRTFFRLCADNERQAAVAAEFAHARLGRRRVVGVHDGTGYGQPLVEAFARRFTELSGTDVVMLGMHVGQEDFGEVVEGVRAAGADLVYLGATEVEGSKLTIALFAAGLFVQVITSEGGPHNPFAAMAGPAGEGSIHTYAGADPLATPASRRLAERCQAEIGVAPSYLLECRDAVAVIVNALDRGAATRSEVLEAIASTDLEGFSGRIRFDASGDRIDAPVSLWRVAGGRMVRVEEGAAP